MEQTGTDRQSNRPLEALMIMDCGVTDAGSGAATVSDAAGRKKRRRLCFKPKHFRINKGRFYRYVIFVHIRILI